MAFLERVPLVNRFARGGDTDEDDEALEDAPSAAADSADADEDGGAGGFLGRLRDRFRKGPVDELEFEEDSADDDPPPGRQAGGAAVSPAARTSSPPQGRPAAQPETPPQGSISALLNEDSPGVGSAAVDPADADTEAPPGEEGGEDGIDPESPQEDLGLFLKGIFQDTPEENQTLKDLASSMEDVSAAELAADLKSFLEEQEARWG